MNKSEFLIRGVEVRDAIPRNELDRCLAKDGRGMVAGPNQVDSADDERSRIVSYLADLGASLDIVAVADDGRILASAKIRQFKQVLCQHVGVVALGVDPEYQNMGIGREIMVALLDRVNWSVLLRLELYVRADNFRAIGLYESLGFWHEGVRKSFVRLDDGTFVDDLIMVRLSDSVN